MMEERGKDRWRKKEKKGSQEIRRDSFNEDMYPIIYFFSGFCLYL